MPGFTLADTLLSTDMTVSSQTGLDALGSLTFANGTLGFVEAGLYTFNNSITLNSGTANTLSYTGTTGAAVWNLTPVSPLVIDGSSLTVDTGSSDSALAAAITVSNGGVFAKSGTGTLLFSGTITGTDPGTGAVMVSQGTLTLGSDYAIDSPATVQIGPGAILDIGATTQTVSGLTSAGAGTVHIGEGVLYINGSSTPAPVQTDITGVGTLDFQYATLSRSLSFTGNVQVSGSLDLTIADALLNADSVEVNGWLNLNGLDQTLHQLSGGGTLYSYSFSSPPPVLTLDNSTGDTEFSGSITAYGIQTTALLKTGSGQLTLSGSDLSALTSLDVEDGTLAITADSSLSPAVTATIASSGTLQLSSVQTFSALSGDGNVIADSVLTVGALDSNLHLSGSGTLQLAGDVSLGSNFTLTGALVVDFGTTLTLTAADAISSAGSVTANGTIDLGASHQTLNQLSGVGVLNNPGLDLALVNADADSTYSGAISGSGFTTLQKTGPYTLTLSGSDLSAFGYLNVQAGTLAITGNDSLVGAPGATIAAGATLSLGSGSNTFSALYGSGSVLVDGLLSLVEGSEGIGFDQRLTLSGSGSLRVAGNLTLGDGEVSPFALTGALLVDSGTLILATAGAVASASNVNVASGATLDMTDTIQVLHSLTGAGTVAAANSQLELAVDAGTAVFSGDITGDAISLAYDGAGTQVLSGRVGDSLASLTVYSGTLQITQDGALPASVFPVIGTDGTLDIASSHQTIAGAASEGTPGRINIAAGGVLTVQPLSSAELPGTSTSVDAILTGAGDFVATGGTVALNAAAELTGQVFVESGATLDLVATNAIAASSEVNIASGATLDMTDTIQVLHSLTGAGTVAAANSQLELAVDAGTAVFSGDITGDAISLAYDGAGTQVLSGRVGDSLASLTVYSGTLQITQDGALPASVFPVIGTDGTLDIASSHQTIAGAASEGTPGRINIAAGGVLTVQPLSSAELPSASTSVDAILTGAGDFVATGGTVALNAAAELTGQVFVESGATLDLVATNAIAASSEVNIASGATLQGRGSQTLQHLQGSGTLLLGYTDDLGTFHSGALNFNAATDSIFDGTLAGAGSTLDKYGTGQLRLNGDASAMTGLATVHAGRLSINGTYGGGASVLSGGMLGGTGTVLGGVNVASGGWLDPGNSIGTITVGSLTLQPGSTLRIEADDAGHADQVISLGDVSIAGATLLLVPTSGTFSAGSTYSILTASGTVSGEFATVSSSLPLLGLTTTYRADSVSLAPGESPTTPATVVEVTIPTPNHNAEISAVDPVAGGPGSLLQQMTVADADAGIWSDPQDIGFGNGQAALGLGFGQFNVDGYRQRWQTLPLQYSWKLDNGTVAILDAPIVNISTDGHGHSLRNRSFSPGGGLRIPINDDWQIKPIVRWGTVVDDDYNHIGSLASGTLTSHYKTQLNNDWQFGMDNMVGVYRSVGGNVHGLDASYDLNETVLRNSVRLGGPLDSTPLGSGARWMAWVTDTRYFGDNLAVSNIQDLGVAVSTRVRSGSGFDQVLHAGLTVQRSDSGGNAIQFNVGYRF